MAFSSQTIAVGRVSADRFARQIIRSKHAITSACERTVVNERVDARYFDESRQIFNDALEQNLREIVELV